MSSKIGHLYIITAILIIFCSLYSMMALRVFQSYQKVRLENQETMIKILIETKNDIFWWNKQAI